MSWIVLTEAQLQDRTAGPEYAAYAAAALAEGQDNPIPGILESVTAMVRGYVASCARNTLGEAGTIPAALMDTACVIARHKICTRLPKVGAKFLDDARIKEFNVAERQLRDVAACKFAIVQPDVPSEESVAATSVEAIPPPTRVATAATLDGLI